jgi:hypothetical protein
MDRLTQERRMRVPKGLGQRDTLRNRIVGELDRVFSLYRRTLVEDYRAAWLSTLTRVNAGARRKAHKVLPACL